MLLIKDRNTSCTFLKVLKKCYERINLIFERFYNIPYTKTIFFIIQNYTKRQRKNQFDPIQVREWHTLNFPLQRPLKPQNWNLQVLLVDLESLL